MDQSQCSTAAAVKAALDLKRQGWAVVEGVIPRYGSESALRGKGKALMDKVGNFMDLG